jgi:2-isopropylmalate synthase
MCHVIGRMHVPEVTICYGMTETSPVSFQSQVDDPIELRVSTVGRFKALADRKKELFDGDIEALVMRAGSDAAGPWSLHSLDVATRDHRPARVTIALAHTDGRVVRHEQMADGPVDAVVKAIDHLTGMQVQLRTFDVHSMTVGDDAQGEALLTVECDGRTYRGAGISTNIIEAAARAYLEVVNRIDARSLRCSV